MPLVAVRVLPWCPSPDTSHSRGYSSPSLCSPSLVKGRSFSHLSAVSGFSRSSAEPVSTGTVTSRAKALIPQSSLFPGQEVIRFLKNLKDSGTLSTDKIVRIVSGGLWDLKVWPQLEVQHLIGQLTSGRNIWISSQPEEPVCLCCPLLALHDVLLPSPQDFEDDMAREMVADALYNPADGISLSGSTRSGRRPYPHRFLILWVVRIHCCSTLNDPEMEQHYP